MASINCKAVGAVRTPRARPEGGRESGAVAGPLGSTAPDCPTWNDVTGSPDALCSDLGPHCQDPPPRRATTVTRDRIVLRTHFIPALGDRALSTITSAYVEGFVDTMMAKLAPTTVRTNLRVQNAAVDADLIARRRVYGAIASSIDVTDCLYACRVMAIRIVSRRCPTSPLVFDSYTVTSSGRPSSTTPRGDTEASSGDNRGSLS